jgi:hypothetical protein
MSIELSDLSKSPFTELNLSERREVARAIHRAERLEAARGTASGVVDEARAIEASMAARGVHDPAARREAAEAVAAAVTSRGQLDTEVQEYRGLLFDGKNRSSQALGQYVTLLREARGGDLEAIASVRTAQTELAEARAENDAVDQYGRFVIRDENGLSLGVTNSAGAALQALQQLDASGASVYDRDQSARAVARLHKGLGYFDPAFEAAANIELGALGTRRSTPGVSTPLRDDDAPDRKPEQSTVGFVDRAAHVNELAPSQVDAAREADHERLARLNQATAFPKYFERHYAVVGDRIVDAKQNDRVVMVDKASKLEAGRDFDSETVRLMVETAKARGWGDAVVRGTPDFKQAVWLAAVTAGIEVKGHEPTLAEQTWAKRQREAAGERFDATKSAAHAFDTAKTADERKIAAQAFPELVKAFALDAAVASFAKRIQSQDGRDAFTARLREHIKDDIAAGRPIVEVRVRQGINDELRRQQERQPERDR